jgi:hypothetical protein
MTSRYGRPLEFGISIVPTSVELTLARALARRADELGLDLIGVQDHPYQWRFLETWSLLADPIARTERIRCFPDVANPRPANPGSSRPATCAAVAEARRRGRWRGAMAVALAHRRLAELDRLS